MMNKYISIFLFICLIFSTTAHAKYCSNILDVDVCREGCDAIVVDMPFLDKKNQYIHVDVMTSTTTSVRCFVATTQKLLYNINDKVIVIAKPYDRDNSNVTIIELSKTNNSKR